MGASGTKEKAPSPPPVETAAAAAASSSTEAGKADAPPTQKKSQMQQYQEFRDDLQSFSLGEAAYDYAKRLKNDQPDNPALLALFGETAWMYEKVKNPTMREHWTDRMEVFQEGIDATRKCIREHPEYKPCLRVYTLLAAKFSEQKYYWKLLQPLGTIEHLNGVINRGQQSLDAEETPDVLAAMAQLEARVASNTKKPYSPYAWYARYNRLPSSDELMERALKRHLRVQELQPNNVENACRTGMLYYEMGITDKAKRWYQKTRDELICDDPAQEVYQTVAHTHLTTHVARNSNWNVPFG